MAMLATVGLYSNLIGLCASPLVHTWAGQYMFLVSSFYENAFFSLIERGCLANDSVYVFLFHPGELYRHLRNGNFVNFGSYLMGDEKGTMEINSYENLTHYAFRNYWFDRYRANAHFVPLGIKSGLNFGESDMYLPASRRAYLCNFVGTANGRPERQYMFDVLQFSIKTKCFIKKEGAWPTNAKGMHALIYRDILHDSKFTLAPFGNNPESLRFYEALEGGSIPITTYAKEGTEQDDFIYAGILHAIGEEFYNQTKSDSKPYDFQFREVPIPRVRDWKDANEVIEYYETHVKEMDALQVRVVDWWRMVKKKIQSSIRQTIDDSFERTYGSGS